MGRLGFWKSDWFLGVLVTIAMIAAARTDLIQSLERKAYDLGVRASSRVPADEIAIIAIDDPSIANLGRWPWPRDLHAEMIDRLAAAKPKVIASTIAYFEPQIDPGYAYVGATIDDHIASGEFRAAARHHALHRRPRTRPA